MYHALKDGNEFFGVFKKEKMIKNLAYIHVNEKGIIKDISASKLSQLAHSIGWQRSLSSSQLV